MFAGAEAWWLGRGGGSSGGDGGCVYDFGSEVSESEVAGDGLERTEDGSSQSVESRVFDFRTDRTAQEYDKYNQLVWAIILRELRDTLMRSSRADDEQCSYSDGPLKAR